MASWEGQGRSRRLSAHLRKYLDGETVCAETDDDKSLILGAREWTPGIDLMTNSGLRLKLGKSIGRGGEGQIFSGRGRSPFAVKLYTDGKAAERREKINAMISDRCFDRTPFVAFPMEAVISKGAFVGFTMRQALGVKPLHQLCTPGDRKIEFPAANYRFLVRVALNFALRRSQHNETGRGHRRYQ